MNKTCILKIKAALVTTLIFNVTLLLPLDGESFANEQFSQIILKFKLPKSYDYSYDKNAQTLNLKLKNTNLDEVQPLDYYDESTIKRVILKQIDGNLDINITLKKPDLGYTIAALSDPFRIAIDIYDANYREIRDPVTKLPIEINPPSSYLDSNLNHSDDFVATSIPLPNPETAKNENLDQSPKYNLVQPLPEDFSAQMLKEMTAKIPEGPGKSWGEYPLYVYRLNLNAYKGREKPQGGVRRGNEDRYNASLRAAEFAESQYDYGHESRALFIFQHALNTDPRVFDDDAYYLWALAETQFGQGNISLAAAYFKSLTEKHPSSPLAEFAQIRMIDCDALSDESQQKNLELKEKLWQRLNLIHTRDDFEATALIEIRKSFHAPNAAMDSKSGLPVVSSENVMTLKSLIEKVENPRTKFLLSALSMAHYADINSSWSKENAEFAAKFFADYSKSNEKQVVDGIRDNLKIKLSQLMQKNLSENNFLETIRIYEDLPKSLQSIKKDPGIAWVIGESFRKAGNGEASIDFYQIAATGSDKDQVLKSHFWLASLSKFALKNSRQSLSKKRREEFYKLAKSSDQSLYSIYKDLPEDIKLKVSAEYKSYFEDTVLSRLALRSSALIVLESFENSSVTNTPSAANEVIPGGVTKTGDSFAGNVRLLSLLSKNFAELQMPAERRRALKLMRQLTPSEDAEDQEAEKTWTQDLVDLAEEMRLASNYLEAGKIYAETAGKSQNWDKRHEARYKAGLLLYRAGRHGEATQLLQEACNDGENIFYKNLACERLDQLKK